MGARAHILLTGLVGLSVATSASAQCVGSCTTGVAYAPGQGSPNSVSLQLPVTASVGAACGFATAPSGTHNEPDFDTHSWSHNFDFQLDCSIPARIGVVSSNGALLTSGSPPAGYATQAPYNVALRVVMNGAVVINSGSCAAADLVAGGSCSFRGPANNTGQGFLVSSASKNQTGSYLQVSAPAYTGANILVASAGYADTLTVTLSPAS